MHRHATDKSEQNVPNDDRAQVTPLIVWNKYSPAGDQQHPDCLRYLPRRNKINNDCSRILRDLKSKLFLRWYNGSQNVKGTLGSGGDQQTTAAC